MCYFPHSLRIYVVSCMRDFFFKICKVLLGYLTWNHPGVIEEVWKTRSPKDKNVRETLVSGQPPRWRRGQNKKYLILGSKTFPVLNFFFFFTSGDLVLFKQYIARKEILSLQYVLADCV